MEKKTIVRDYKGDQIHEHMVVESVADIRDSVARAWDALSAREELIMFQAFLTKTSLTAPTWDKFEAWLKLVRDDNHIDPKFLLTYSQQV